MESVVRRVDKVVPDEDGGGGGGVTVMFFRSELEALMVFRSKETVEVEGLSEDIRWTEGAVECLS